MRFDVGKHDANLILQICLFLCKDLLGKDIPCSSTNLPLIRFDVRFDFRFDPINQGGYPGANAQEPDPLRLLATDVLRTDQRSGVWWHSILHRKSPKLRLFHQHVQALRSLKWNMAELPFSPLNSTTGSWAVYPIDCLEGQY